MRVCVRGNSPLRLNMRESIGDLSRARAHPYTIAVRTRLPHARDALRVRTVSAF